MIHVQDTKIPMIGKINADVIMYDKAFILDEDQIVIETESKISGVPYGDHFEITGAYFMTQKSRGVEFSQAMNVKWHKSTFL